MCPSHYPRDRQRTPDDPLCNLRVHANVVPKGFRSASKPKRSSCPEGSYELPTSGTSWNAWVSGSAGWNSKWRVGVQSRI